MTKKILMGASFLAMLAAFPAFAEVKADSQTDTKAKIENTLDKAGDSIERTAEKTQKAVKEAYSDVKAYFSDDKDVKAVTSVNVLDRITADEIVGRKVQNPKGEDIGKIEDILVSADGDAEAVIINDGGVLGLGGKMAAFDYDVIEGISADKNVVVKLSEENIKNAKAYDPEKPMAGRYSIDKIMDAKVVDAKGKKLADVDTVAFDGDDADYLVVTFDKILGMGGDKAALNLDALKLTDNKGNYTFTLNEQQSAQFENYKETTKAN